MFDADDAERNPVEPRLRNRQGKRAPSLLSMGTNKERQSEPQPPAPAPADPPTAEAEPVEPARPAPAAAPSEPALRPVPIARDRLGERIRRRLRAAARPAPASREPARVQVPPIPEPARNAYQAPQPVPPAPAIPREPVALEADARDEWRPLIEPGTLLMGVMRSKAIILLCTVAGAAIGVAVALSTPKMYSATADLLVDPRSLQIVDRGLSQPGFSSDGGLALVENQVRIMTSGTVLNGVVERLDLEADPEFNGTAEAGGFPNPLNTLRALLSGGGEGGEADPGMRRGITVNQLAQHVQVGRSGSTFIVSITAQSRDAEKAATIANTMTEVYLQTAGEFEASTAGRASDELTARLDELRRSVEAAERAVETFKRDNGIIDAQGRLITDDEIVKLNDQLSTARARTAELRARAASAQALDADAVIGGILPEQVASGVMSELRAQSAALQQEVDRLAVRLGPRHPQRQAVEAQLSGLRSQIATELSRITSSLQVELDRAAELERDLGEQLEQLKTRQGELSGELVTLRELEREAASSRAVYEAFLLRARETGEQQNINTTNVNVISPATAPLQPGGPSRALIALTGIILGFGAGVGIGLLRGAADSVRDNGGFRAAQRRQRAPGKAPGSELMQEELPGEAKDADSVAAVVPPLVATAAQPAPEPVAPVVPRDETAPNAALGNAPRENVTASPRFAPLSRNVPPQASQAMAHLRGWDEATASRAAPTGPASAPVDELRESLREFREAVRELAEIRRSRGA